MEPLDDRRTDPITRERIDQALDAAATEAAQEAARKTARRAAGGYFLLLLFLLAGAVVYQRATNERVDNANQRLDRSEMRACERLQVQRERANVSEARQYLLLRAVATSPRASAQVKARYGALSSTTVYDPPTDCEQAVSHPNTYQRPPSVRFAELPADYIEAIVKAAKDRRPQPLPGG